MSSSSKTPSIGSYFGVIFVVILIIIALISILSSIISNLVIRTTQTPTIASSPMVVETGPESTIVVKYTAAQVTCLADGVVDYIVIEMFISGGIEPYEIRITNSALEVFGPYILQSEVEPILIKIFGGETIKIQIWSYGSSYPDWEGSISIPSEDSTCFSTQTPLPTNTLSATPPVGKTSTNKPPVISTKTRTPAVPLSTSTSIVNPTKTPFIPTVTNVPFTPTLIPGNTATPINPNPKECEDGIDNDGDGQIDYPNDPECSRPSDPHENK